MTAPAVVIPVSPGHEENLENTIIALNGQYRRPAAVVVVAHRFGLEGQGALRETLESCCFVPWTLAVAHDDQAPRTVGANVVAHDLRQYGVRRVAFLDSDLIVDRGWLQSLDSWMDVWDADVIAGPYEFLAPGEHWNNQSTRNDTRWPLFYLARVRANTDNGGAVWMGDVTRGLALYGGNLLWNLDKFLELGGFLPLVRGEDGEMGIRAARNGIKMGFDWDARGWHQWHEVNLSQILEQNRRDIPKIWDIHGDYLEAHGISMVAEDGMRLNIKDTAGWCDNTAHMWEREIARPEGAEWIRP